jgi:hypothetical protein
LNIDNSHLVRTDINWHFSLAPPWRPGFMSKGTNDRRAKEAQQKTLGTTPPPLSEKLIAKLQMAVGAAQRKRMPDPSDASAGEFPERRR